MRKVQLDIGKLRVESFATAGAASGTVRGTVNAHGLATRNCPATGMTFCETNCDCTLGCPSIAPCTQLLG